MVVEGNATTPSGPRKVQLTVRCTSVLAAEMVVPDAADSGFDFDPFEGPYAPGAEQPLSTTQLSAKPGPLSRLVREMVALKGQDAHFRWTLRGYEANTRIDAVFELDAAQQATLQTIVANCPPGKQKAALSPPA